MDTTNEIVGDDGRASFSVFDYSIFSAMLGLSAAIGIYFGCFGSKQSTAKEYLMGEKQMKVIPIAMSLVASHVSGITLLGVPADVYIFGAGYWLCLFVFPLMTFLSVYVYLPVFFKLGITSTYEYLQMRFDNKTRLFASFLFALSCLLYLPVVIYLPALALSATTGINLHLITPIVCAVCVFYTTIGGLKAVVWTDTLQFTITCCASVAVIVIGAVAAGGVGTIWEKAVESNRLNIFDFDPDVTRRDTFWEVVIGFSFYWMSFTSTSQGCVQKFLSVSTIQDVRLTGLFYFIGLSLISTVSVFTGLMIYTKYSACDPFEAGQVTNKDQLLVYYVQELSENIPGFSGLFIAGIFSAALSTLSAHLNCVSGTIYEDFLKKRMSTTTTEKRKANILRLIVVIAGIICTAMVFLVEKLGGIAPLAISFNSVSGGPMLGLFTLGVLVPRANKKGAFYGGIIGLITSFSVIMTYQYYAGMGLIQYPVKPIGIESCTFNISSPSTTFLELGATDPPVLAEYQPFFLFRISYYYHTLIGFIFTMVAGLIISLLTKKDEPVSKNLFSPFIRRWLSDIRYTEQEEVTCDSVEDIKRPKDKIIYNKYKTESQER